MRAGRESNGHQTQSQKYSQRGGLPHDKSGEMASTVDAYKAALEQTLLSPDYFGRNSGTTPLSPPLQ